MFKQSKADLIIKKSKQDKLKHKNIPSFMLCLSQSSYKIFKENSFCDICGMKRIEITHSIKYDERSGKPYRLVVFDCPYHLNRPY